MTRKNAEDQSAPAEEAAPEQSRAGAGKIRKPDSKSHWPRVLPTGSDEDSYRAWGDSDDSNDERLRREKPPHW